MPYTSIRPWAAVKGFHIMKLIEWKGTKRAYCFGLVSLRCLRHVSFYYIRFFSKAHDFWGLSQLPSCQCHLFASKRFSGLFLPLEVIGIVTDVMTDVSLGPVGYPIANNYFPGYGCGCVVYCVNGVLEFPHILAG